MSGSGKAQLASLTLDSPIFPLTAVRWRSDGRKQNRHPISKQTRGLPDSHCILGFPFPFHHLGFPAPPMAAPASISAGMDSLESFSSALSAFTSSWRSLESHLSAIDSSLTSHLAALNQTHPRPEASLEKLAGSTLETSPEKLTQASPEAELRRLCVAMDGVGLRTYVVKHLSELKSWPENALDDAILAAPDPARLVLGAADGFWRAGSGTEMDGDIRSTRRTCLNFLDRLRALGVKPLPLARAEAREVAVQWRHELAIGKGDCHMETISFLLLVGVFGLVDDVGGADEVLNLVVSIAGRKRAVEVFVGLGLDLTKHMPALLQKLRSEGKQLEEIKFIHAVNLWDKYPLLPIIRSYMDGAAKNASIAKQRASLRVLQNFLKVQKIEEPSINGEVKKRMKQLEQRALEERERQLEEKKRQLEEKRRQLEEKKRLKGALAAASAAAAEASKNILQLQAQPAKRPRLSAAMPTPNIYPVTIQSKHQVASNQNVFPAVTQNQHPVASNQNVRPVVFSDEPLYGGYHSLASSRYLYGPEAGPSLPGASLSRTPQLYSAAHLRAGLERPGSSYKYSLSSMSTYDRHS